VLKGGEAREPTADEIPNELLEEQIVNRANCDGPASAEPFVGKVERQLMEGKHMHVKPRPLAHSAQKALDVPKKWVRGNENRDGREGIGGLRLAEMFHEG
jgi:hypothetical protein